MTTGEGPTKDSKFYNFILKNNSTTYYKNNNTLNNHKQNRSQQNTQINDLATQLVDKI